MITQLSLVTAIKPDGDIVEQESDFALTRLQKLFLDENFMLEKDEVKKIYSINILGIYKNFIGESDEKSQKSNRKTIKKEQTETYPAVLDYQQLIHKNPKSSIINQIVDQEKLNDNFTIVLHKNRVLFDSNFEQLTLLLHILNNLFDIDIFRNNEFLSFSTYSYIFSFDLTKGLSKIFDNKENWEFAKNAIEELVELPFQLNIPMPLKNYIGVNVTVENQDSLFLIRLTISGEFTQNSIVLSSGSIQKSSLFYLSLILERFSEHIPTQFDYIKKIQEAIEYYLHP